MPAISLARNAERPDGQLGWNHLAQQNMPKSLIMWIFMCHGWFIYRAVYLSMWLLFCYSSSCLSTYLFIYLFIYLLTCILTSICIIYPSLYLYLSPSSLSISLLSHSISFHIYIYLSIYLYLSVYDPILQYLIARRILFVLHPSLHPSIYHLSIV